MRICLKFFANKDKIVLPIHYNHIVQSFIYRCLDKTLAMFFHEKGYTFLKRKFKLFTFSRIIAKKHRFLKRTQQIIFKGKAWLKIGAMDNRFLESIALYLVKKGCFRLGENICELDSVEVEMPPLNKGPVLVKAISPISIRSTLFTPDGKRKSYFYSPFEDEFSEKLLDNLMRKAYAYWGKNIKLPSLNGAYVKPVKVSKRNEAIVNFKGFWIKGWTGIYEINLPDPFFELAYNAGLGARNSQGFGMIDVIREGCDKSG